MKRQAGTVSLTASMEPLIVALVAVAALVVLMFALLHMGVRAWRTRGAGRARAHPPQARRPPRDPRDRGVPGRRREARPGATSTPARPRAARARTRTSRSRRGRARRPAASRRRPRASRRAAAGGVAGDRPPAAARRWVVGVGLGRGGHVHQCSGARPGGRKPRGLTPETGGVGRQEGRPFHRPPSSANAAFPRAEIASCGKLVHRSTRRPPAGAQLPTAESTGGRNAAGGWHDADRPIGSRSNVPIRGAARPPGGSHAGSLRPGMPHGDAARRSCERSREPREHLGGRDAVVVGRRLGRRVARAGRVAHEEHRGRDVRPPGCRRRGRRTTAGRRRSRRTPRRRRRAPRAARRRRWRPRLRDSWVMRAAGKRRAQLGHEVVDRGRLERAGVERARDPARDRVGRARRDLARGRRCRRRPGARGPPRRPPARTGRPRPARRGGRPSASCPAWFDSPSNSARQRCRGREHVGHAERLAAVDQRPALLDVHLEEAADVRELGAAREQRLARHAVDRGRVAHDGERRHRRRGRRRSPGWRSRRCGSARPPRRRTRSPPADGGAARPTRAPRPRPRARRRCRARRRRRRRRAACRGASRRTPTARRPASGVTAHRLPAPSRRTCEADALGRAPEPLLRLGLERRPRHPVPAGRGAADVGELGEPASGSVLGIPPASGSGRIRG